MGVLLSVIADAVIAVSLNLTKLAHNRNQHPETGQQRKPYTRVPLWWLAMLLNAGGEVGNLVACKHMPGSWCCGCLALTHVWVCGLPP